MPSPGAPHGISGSIPSKGPESLRPPGRKLDAWKEIADYLDREVRTVQRWEKTEHLPVHRHEHQKKSSVYAYTSELDEWVKKRQPVDDPEADAAFESENSGADLASQPAAVTAVEDSSDSRADTKASVRKWKRVTLLTTVAVAIF